MGEFLNLFSGLGVGIIAHSLDLHGINVEAVELDPVIPYYATRYFNLPFTLKQTVMDGAEFVKKADSSKYDYVVHDIFTGGSISGILLTRSFFKDLKATLKPHGILALVISPSHLSERVYGSKVEFCRLFRHW